MRHVFRHLFRFGLVGFGEVRHFFGRMDGIGKECRQLLVQNSTPAKLIILGFDKGRANQIITAQSDLPKLFGGLA